MSLQSNDPKIQIRCAEDTKRRFKAICAEQGTNMQDVGLDLIMKWMDEHDPGKS